MSRRGSLVALLLLVPATAGAQAISPVGPTCLPAPHEPLQLARLEPLGDGPGYPLCEHVDQHALDGVPFRRLFLAGDALFAATYTALDGVGANLRRDSRVSLRFSRIPRADLPGFAGRVTGPNASACTECHRPPASDAVGAVALNVFRDPFATGDPREFVQRNTPALAGAGAVQLLAEELTTELQAIREAARTLAVSSRAPVEVPLRAKGLDFGRLTALPGGRVVEVRSTHVDRDLVVRPFQWKGTVASLREFVRGEAHHELGLQAEELVGANVDQDGDRVANELTTGDLTALVLYVAAQPPPVRLTEWSEQRSGTPPAERVRSAVVAGERVFARIGCTSCHVPELRLWNSVYSEPSRHPAFRDRRLAGQPPAVFGLDPAAAVRFDLRADVTPPFEVAPATGEVRVRLYSDLRRHDLGPALAEDVDEAGTGAARFLTRPLWGVGATAPYLHDGRASTLTEAILLHGGDAVRSRDAFAELSEADRTALVEFLKDLWIVKP